MNLLGLQIRRLAESKAGRPTNEQLTREHGATGVRSLWGVLSNVGEHVPALRPGNKYQTYDKMRRSDGQVFAALTAMKLPILSATWTVRCEDERVRAFVEENLFGRINWRQFLRQAMTFLDFGFSVFEKVFEVEAGRVLLKKLAMRLQSTIYKWEIGEHDELSGIVQRAFKQGRYRQIQIPREKLVLFNLDQEGNDFEGRSILRAAYKHWYIKDQLERIGAIAADRHGVGVPIDELQVDPDRGIAITDDDYKSGEEILKNLKAGAKSWIVAPPGHRFRVLDQADKGFDVMPQVRYHAEEIAKSMLAQFINLGTTQTGSRALAESDLDMFLVALQGIAHEISETVNEDIVAPLVAWNFGEAVRAEVAATNIRRANVERIAKAATQLAGAGLLNADSELEAHLRQMMDLPPRE